jgi:ribosomal protein S18 acetylase RimI-like enzyme
MTSEVVIRKAVSTDMDAMIELLRLLFAIETDFVFDGERQRLGLASLLQMKNTACILVAERSRQVVGMCTAQLLVSTAEGGIKAIIEDVAVSEGCRGQGIGTQLLTAMEEWAVKHKAKRLDLLADRRNKLALDFYQQLGWQKTELVCLQKKL